MKHYQITSIRDGSILYAGNFKSFRHCIQDAIKNGANLNGADLRNKNLANAALDDASFEHADFSGTNLTGANLSEARLGGALFRDVDLYNTCLAYSDMRGCRFENASFGATDITGCDLSFCIFSTLSCFSLDFVLASAMRECVFVNACGRIAKMSAPPVVIKGTSCNMIIFMDHDIKIGHDLMDYEAGLTFLKKKPLTN